MFTNIQDAVNWIESVKKFGDKLDLSRMELACKLLGNPEKKLPVIHIAGTNGKGSTVSYLKHILLEQGYNVGTFTSPYIVRFNERITFNYNDISNEELLKYINEVYSLHYKVLDKYNQVITFFELVTLISFMYFTSKQPDFVLYEVGLGGRLDATNVVAPIMGTITSISFDHMGVLGDTLQEIAKEKLGIVKQGMPLITAVDQEELIPTFSSYCELKDSELTFINRNHIDNVSYGETTSFNYKGNPYKIKMLGVHQVVNASLAIEVIHQLQLMNRCEVSEQAIQNGLLQTYWPGRMEMFGNIIIDGAHNIGGVNALKESMLTLFPDKTIKVLFTSMADKEYFDNIQVLESFAHELHFTQFEYPRCETAENLYNISQFHKKYLHTDAVQALNTLRNLEKDEILLVTGSLYFISYIRKYI